MALSYFYKIRTNVTTTYAWWWARRRPSTVRTWPACPWSWTAPESSHFRSRPRARCRSWGTSLSICPPELRCHHCCSPVISKCTLGSYSVWSTTLSIYTPELRYHPTFLLQPVNTPRIDKVFGVLLCPFTPQNSAIIPLLACNQSIHPAPTTRLSNKRVYGTDQGGDGPDH